MTAQVKITSRIDGWGVLVAINETMAVKIVDKVFAPIGRGKDRSRRIARLRKAYHDMWDATDLWNSHSTEANSPYFKSAMFTVL